MELLLFILSQLGCEESARAAASMKMKTKAKLLSRLFCSLLAVLFFASLPAPAEVLKIVVDDTIQPITEEYISRAVDEAQRSHDQALLIELNTPGGLLDSTRAIVSKISNSQVPVIIY